jgi:UDP-glucose 6-dehydrogenase
MKVGIVGVGVVGGALRDWFQKQTDHELRLNDPAKDLEDSLKDVEVAFLCLPVLNDADGVQNAYALDAWVEWFAEQNPGAVLFVKSTVLPGTCDQLSQHYKMAVWHMPEFLTERTSLEDFEKHPIVSASPQTAEFGDLMVRIFPNKEIWSGFRNREAELAKYAHNLYGALSVYFWNLIHLHCDGGKDGFGAQYENVLNIAAMSGHVSMRYSQVPGPDGKFGFGGKCFPKDLQAFARFLGDEKVLGAKALQHIFDDNILIRTLRK